MGSQNGLDNHSQEGSQLRSPHPRYEKAGQDVKESMKNWAKQQEAELAEDRFFSFVPRNKETLKGRAHFFVPMFSHSFFLGGKEGSKLDSDT